VCVCVCVRACVRACVCVCVCVPIFLFWPLSDFSLFVCVLSIVIVINITCICSGDQL